MPNEELERLEIQIDADASGVAPASRKASASIKAMQGSVEKSMAGARKAIESTRTSIQGVVQAQKAVMSSVTPKKRANTDAIAAQADEIYANLSRARKEVNVLKKEWSQAVRQSGSAGFSSADVVSIGARLASARKNVESLEKRAEEISEKLLKSSEGEQYVPMAEGAKEAAESVIQLAAAEAQAAREATETRKQIRAANDELDRTDKTAVKARRSTQNIFGSIGSSLRSMLVISSITRLVRNMISGLWSAAKSNSQFATSLGRIKGNLLTAFAPIYNAVLPWLNALASALVNATAALASFVSTLFGLSIKNSQNIAAGLDNIGASAASAGGSAKKALAAFDELNTLDSGGGGGGGGVTGGIGAIYEEIEASDRLQNVMKEILQLVVSVGGAIAAWKIASNFLPGLTNAKDSLRFIAGIAATIWGVIESIVNLVDMWNNGITKLNSNDAFQGILAVVLGLSLAISPVAGAIAAIAGGVMLIVPSIKELITGEASIDTLTNALRGLGLVLAGIGALTGNIPLLIIGAVGVAASYVVEYWEEIKAWGVDAAEWIKQKGKDAIDWTKGKIDWLRLKINQFIDWLKRLPQRVTQWIVTGVQEMGQKILDAMPQWLKDMLGLTETDFEAYVNLKADTKEFDASAMEIEQQIREMEGGATVPIMPQVNGSEIVAEFEKRIQSLENPVDVVVNAYVDKANGMISTLKENLSSIATTVSSTIKVNVQLTEKGESVLTRLKSTFGSAGSVLSGAIGKLVGLDLFASGGMNIDRGQLFIANEAGAELVGTIGGKTAVANQQEIGNAIFRYMDVYGAQRGGGISEQAIANAIAKALDGAAVKVGEDKLGELTIKAINKYQRNAGEMLLEI